MTIVKAGFKICAIFFLCSFFTQCVSSKKHASKMAAYEKKIVALKNDSLYVQQQLIRIKQDSASMQTQLTELLAYKEKNETKNTSLVRTKKPKTISEEKEYDAVAAFIYNITKYVEWPAETKEQSFKIGILGNSKLEQAIRSTLVNKKNQNQPFEVQGISSIKEIKNCQLLVISKSNPNSMASIKSVVGKFPTLLLTEGEDYIKPEAHVNIRVDGDDVKMAVNKESIKYAKFKVSKTLFNLSEQ